jgi:5-carboxymethyl-2-hydroxymuconate isomerase
MPDVLVETRANWLGSRKEQLLDAIHAAMVEALHIPADDKILRLVEHSADCFAIPASSDGKFTHIEITLFEGRALDTKRALYRTIVRNLAAFAVAARDVKIVLLEVKTEDVGMRGGQAACDLDIGYEIAV